MTMVDLEPAARRMSELIRRVPDEALSGPTPCPEYTLGDLVEHVGGLAQAFTAAAAKRLEAGRDQPPAGDVARLPPDWRERIPRDLEAMAQAWREPEAWAGMTRAGGVDLPGEAAGVVALDELVVHGWDVARASGQPYDCDESSLGAVYRFVAQVADQESPDSLFGPRVAVADDRPLLDQVLGLTGRDPDWVPR